MIMKNSPQMNKRAKDSRRFKNYQEELNLEKNSDLKTHLIQLSKISRCQLQKNLSSLLSSKVKMSIPRLFQLQAQPKKTLKQKQPQQSKVRIKLQLTVKFHLHLALRHHLHLLVKLQFLCLQVKILHLFLPARILHLHLPVKFL